MPTQKIDLLFSNVDGYGWTESYYYGPGGLTVPNISLLTLITLRAALLSSDSQINFIRLANIYTRSPFLYDAAYPAAGAVLGNSGETSGPDFVALVLRLQGIPFGVGRLFLRGVPENEYTGDQLLPTVPYQAALNDFTAFLSSGSVWCLNTSSQNTVITTYPVTSLLPLSPRGYQFTSTTALPGVSVGKLIRMHQAIIIGFNGLKKVTKIVGSGPVIYSVGGAKPQAQDDGSNNPFVTVPVYQTPVINIATPEGISRRNAGRFFRQRRGRRSTTLSLRQ